MVILVLASDSLSEIIVMFVLSENLCFFLFENQRRSLDNGCSFFIKKKNKQTKKTTLLDPTCVWVHPHVLPTFLQRKTTFVTFSLFQKTGLMMGWSMFHGDLNIWLSGHSDLLFQVFISSI